MSQGIGLRISVYLILRSCSEFIFNKLKSHKNLIKLPKNKVLTLYQKGKICEMSLTPGFNKKKCEKEFGIQRSCLNKILQSKTKFFDFTDSKKEAL